MTDERTLRDILRRLQRLEQTAAHFRLGVVDDTSPLDVTLGGADAPFEDVAALDGPRLDAGDTVGVLKFGSDALVLGRIGTGEGIRMQRATGTGGSNSTGTPSTSNAPSFTIPTDGLYLLGWHAFAQLTTVSVLCQGTFRPYANGSAIAHGASFVAVDTYNGATIGSNSVVLQSAGDVIDLRYWVSGGSGTMSFSNMVLTALPVSLG